MNNYLARNNWLVWLIVGVCAVGAQLLVASMPELGLNLPLWPVYTLGALFCLLTGFKVATTRTLSAKVGRIILTALAIVAVVAGLLMKILLTR